MLGTAVKIAAWVGGVLLVCAGVLELFFIDRIKVGHNGMAPTLVAGDHVAVWLGPTTEMGRIVVCPHPTQPGQLVMGRIIAKAGMTLETVRGQLKVVNTIAESDAQGTKPFFDTVAGRQDNYLYSVESLGNFDYTTFQRERTTLNIRSTKVRSGVFLLGDNRSLQGQDSRSFGDVDPQTCLGRVVMRLEPTEGGKALGHGRFDLIK